MNLPLPATLVRKLTKGMAPMDGDAAKALVQKARIGRRVRLPEEERKRRRRAQNTKAMRACRMRRVAKGLRGDGKLRRRQVREVVLLMDAGFVDDGEQVLRITAPRVPLRAGMKLLLVYKAPLKGGRA